MTTTIRPAPAPAARLDSLDAYRGFVMFLMMAEVLRISQVAESFPDSPLWGHLKFNTTHVKWGGFSLHDLIQPSFSFLVGVSLPFSIASRQAKGQSFLRMFLHAVWRAVLLTALGIFLRSIGHPQTRYTFEDTLSQIGLGYVFLFLLGFVRIRWQIVAALVILAGYWGAFAWHPLPPPDFNYEKVGVPADWKYHYDGFAAHWNKNSNFAWDFDVWFLNRFPRAEEFKYNSGGYSTLSFIPTLATMILGLIAGGWLKLPLGKPRKVLALLVASAVCLASGFALDHFGICPSVKPIWTPAWALFSGGWCYLMLAGFYAFVDGLGLRWLVYPLIVIGANSIAAYCMDHLFSGFIDRSFATHLPAGWDRLLGEPYAPLVHGGAILFVLWLILWWMYRNRYFVRI